MRDLLKKDAEFVWDSQPYTAFESLKNIIMQSPSLIKSNRCRTDARGTATRIYFTCTRHIKAKLAPIERKMLAIVHGCERFSQYMYCTDESDHKPLEAIMKKPVSAAAKRLQIMILELQRFRYDISIVHRPGKEIPIADCLSRNLSSDNKLVNGEFSHRIDTAVRSLIATLPISEPQMEEIRGATSSDREMQVIKHVILSGWPTQRKECPEIITVLNYRYPLHMVSCSKWIV